MAKKIDPDTIFKHDGHKIRVNLPGIKESQDAQAVYNEAFFRSITSKAMLRVKLEDFMKEQGVWDEEKQLELVRVTREILIREKRLAAGGFRKSEAREVAIEMRVLRVDLRKLNNVRSELDGHTAEGQAENERFNYLVSVCTVYNDTDEPYFKSLKDYISRSDAEAAIIAAQKLAFMIHGLDEDFASKFPENRFLKEFGYVNDDLRLINDDGHLVNVSGDLVDDEGGLVAYDKDGVVYSVDGDGVKLDDTGNYDETERKVFLDDDDEPIGVVKSTKKRKKKMPERAELVVVYPDPPSPKTAAKE